MFNGFTIIVSDGLEYIFNSSTQCYIFDNIESENLHSFSRYFIDYEVPSIAIYRQLQRNTLDFLAVVDVDYVALYLIKTDTHIAVKYICILTHFLGITKKNYTSVSLNFLENNARFESLRSRVSRIENIEKRRAMYA